MRNEDPASGKSRLNHRGVAGSSFGHLRFHTICTITTTGLLKRIFALRMDSVFLLGRGKEN